MDECTLPNNDVAAKKKKKKAPGTSKPEQLRMLGTVRTLKNSGTDNEGVDGAIQVSVSMSGGNIGLYDHRNH